jgi:hypothetical protein
MITAHEGDQLRFESAPNFLKRRQRDLRASAR